MIPVIAVAVTLAGGLWLLAGAVWPARRPLGLALEQLRSPGRPQRTAGVDDPGADRSTTAAVGRWVLRRWRRSALVDDRTAADLALVGRSVEVHAGTAVLGALAGAFAGPLLWALAVAAGVRPPVLVPVWFVVVGALGGWLAPLVALRGAAASARRDFRHALGAYLDVLVLLLAAQEGPESAMELAAGAGTGPAFDELRHATWQARLSGEAVWTALDDLGRTLQVPELCEIASAGALAGESGAAVRKSLTAKARALRTASLASAEADARRQSQSMFAPLVLLGIGFIVFMIYPLVTNLSVGSP